MVDIKSCLCILTFYLHLNLNVEAAVYASLSRPPTIDTDGLKDTSVRFVIPIWKTGDIGDNPPTKYFVKMINEENKQLLKFVSFDQPNVDEKKLTFALPSPIKRSLITVEPVTVEQTADFEVFNVGAAVSLVVGTEEQSVNVIAIVVPIVVTILLLAGLAVCLFFYLRRKNQTKGNVSGTAATGTQSMTALQTPGRRTRRDTSEQGTSRSLTFIDRLTGHSATYVDRLVGSSHMELAEAMESDNLEWIARAIDRVKKSAAGKHMKAELKQAIEVKERLKRIKKPREAVVRMSREALMEIREYPNPPVAVHDIMRAVLLILGTGESITSDWRECQRMCNTLYSPYNHGLFLRIQNFKLRFLHPEIAVRVLQLLQPYSVDSLNQVRDGLGLFHTWAKTMCDEKLKNISPLPKPATGERQNVLLSDLAKLRHF